MRIVLSQSYTTIALQPLEATQASEAEMLTVGRPCKLFAGALFKGPAWQELLWRDRHSSKAGQDTTHSSCFECLQLRSRKQSEMEPWMSTQSWMLQKAGRKLEPKPRGPCEQLALIFRFAMHDVLEIACQCDDSRPRFGSVCFFRRAWKAAYSYKWLSKMVTPAAGDTTEACFGVCLMISWWSLILFDLWKSLSQRCMAEIAW